MKSGVRSQESEVGRLPSSFLLPPSSFSSAFTLIELLAVITIIILLAGIIIGTATYANRKSLESKTKSQLHQISMALELYNRDWGYYPGSPMDEARYYTISHTCDIATSNNNASLYRALTNRDSTGAVYLEMKSDMVQSVVIVTGVLTTYVGNAMIDPYGNLWGYYNGRSTNQFNPRTFDLWSFGLTVTDPTNSLISNWRQQ